MSDFDIWSLVDLESRNAASAGPCEVFLNTSSMQAELFGLPAGGVDTKKPHEWDELYYIVSGQSSFTAADETRDANAGDLIYVAAGLEHRFHDIETPLKVIVFFSKATPA